MIFITADVHDAGLQSFDQLWLKRYKHMTEMDCAIKYAKLANEQDLPLTIFLTGQVARTETAKLLQLFDFCNVEIGGHTWNALQPFWKHYLFEKLTGSYYGSIQKQRKDISCTKHCIEECLEKKIYSWRTHAYKGDDITFSNLAELDFHVVSDRVGPNEQIGYLKDSLLSVPINIIPDHEYVYHGYYSREFMEQDRQLRENPFIIRNYPLCYHNWIRFFKEILKRVSGIRTPKKPFGDMLEPRDWELLFIRQVQEQMAANGFACVLLHPGVMEILDGMATLQRIFKFISNYSCYFLSEINAKYIKESEHNV